MATPFDRLLDGLDWRELPEQAADDGLPYATHEGVLVIGDSRLRVYQLNTGQRVIEASDLCRFFGVNDIDVCPHNPPPFEDCAVCHPPKGD